MGAKKLKSKKGREEAGGGNAAAWMPTFDPATRRRFLRLLTGICAGGIACIVLGYGLRSLETHVHALPRYERQLTLRWANLPDWLRSPDNQHILDTLERRIGLTEQDRLLDPHLAERVARRLGQKDIGWVANVDRVVIEPDGVVSVACRFRRPNAWVEYGKFAYLVDADCVRLPGQYRVADCQNSLLLPVTGVRGGPPPVGQVWAGADVTSGVKLALLLEDRAYRHQIREVEVGNYAGRRDPHSPHIVIPTTRQGSRVIWGRGPDEEGGMEIPARLKLELLERIYRQYGRIDMNEPYVDITTWTDRVSVPSAQGSPTWQDSFVLRR